MSWSDILDQFEQALDQAEAQFEGLCRPLDDSAAANESDLRRPPLRRADDLALFSPPMGELGPVPDTLRERAQGLLQRSRDLEATVGFAIDRHELARADGPSMRGPRSRTHNAVSTFSTDL